MKTNKLPWFIYAWLIISILGFIDATYLTVGHYRNVVPPCSLVHGCGIVTTSAYSTIAGVPLALFGAIYYLAIFLLTFAYIDTKKAWLPKIIGFATLFGFLTSLYLMYVQLFVLSAICIYCMGSALSSTGLFVASLFFFKSIQRPLQNMNGTR